MVFSSFRNKEVLKTEKMMSLLLSIGGSDHQKFEFDQNRVKKIRTELSEFVRFFNFFHDFIPSFCPKNRQNKGRIEDKIYSDKNEWLL